MVTFSGPSEVLKIPATSTVYIEDKILTVKKIVP